MWGMREKCAEAPHLQRVYLGSILGKEKSKIILIAKCSECASNAPKYCTRKEYILGRG